MSIFQAVDLTHWFSEICTRSNMNEAIVDDHSNGEEIATKNQKQTDKHNLLKINAPFDVNTSPKTCVSRY